MSMMGQIMWTHQIQRAFHLSRAYLMAAAAAMWQCAKMVCGAILIRADRPHPLLSLRMPVLHIREMHG